MKILNFSKYQRWMYYFFLGLSLINLHRMLWYYIFENPENWKLGTQNILNNMGNLYFPAFCMYLHWICGILITLLSLIQILPILRSPPYIHYHRIFGTIYCILCVIVSLAGNLFIFSNSTVGGLNMSLAFSCYGWLLFFFSIKTYYSIRQYQSLKHKKPQESKVFLDNHRKWAIRLWILSISGLYYRFVYLILMIFGYPFGFTMRESTDFLRPLDKFLSWQFFIVPLIVTEIYLRK